MVHIMLTSILSPFSFFDENTPPQPPKREKKKKSTMSAFTFLSKLFPGLLTKLDNYALSPPTPYDLNNLQGTTLQMS